FNQPIPCLSPVFHPVLYSSFYVRNIFPWHYPSDNLVFELETAALLVWSKFNVNVTELPATTRLAGEFTLYLSRCSKCFTVRYHWRTNVTFNFEFTFHAVNKYVQVKLTHTADNNLSGFFISRSEERRVGR